MQNLVLTKEDIEELDKNRKCGLLNCPVNAMPEEIEVIIHYNSGERIFTCYICEKHFKAASEYHVVFLDKIESGMIHGVWKNSK